VLVNEEDGGENAKRKRNQEGNNSNATLYAISKWSGLEL
jgi:hypothetical protein